MSRTRFSLLFRGEIANTGELVSGIKPDDGAVDKTVEFFYDAFDQLIGRKVTEGGTTSSRYFVYDQGQIVLEFDGPTASDLTGEETGTGVFLDTLRPRGRPRKQQ